MCCVFVCRVCVCVRFVFSGVYACVRCVCVVFLYMFMCVWFVCVCVLAVRFVAYLISLIKISLYLTDCSVE